MNRQTYQAEQDKENERRIMAHICQRYGVEAEVTPEYCPYDFKTYRPGMSGRALVGLLEVKCRIVGPSPLSVEISRRYWISKFKIDNCIMEAEEKSRMLGYKVSFFLVVEFVEGVYQAMIDRINAKSFRVCLGGRTDRGDKMDIEDGYEVPIYRFEKV